MTQFTALPPADDRYFEDYAPGAVFDLGSIAVEEAEVLSFARRFDPQYYHIDAARAEAGPFGRLAASGWHTASLMMRLTALNYVSTVASLGSPGVDEIRWLKPVFPGDVLKGQITIIEARRSRSKPDRGVIDTLTEMFNQDGERVMTVKAMGMMLLRDRSSLGQPV